MSVPLTKEANYSVGPILVAFIVIGIIVAVGLFMYSSNHHNEYDQSGVHVIVLLHNKTKLPQKVTLPNGNKFDLAPDSVAKVSIGQHKVIKALSHQYDGSEMEHAYQVANRNISNLYITPHGFSNDLTTSEDVVFFNDASYPVLFVQVGKGDRRWVSDIVGPNSSTTGHLVPRQSKWQVVHPMDEDTPISELRVSGRVKSLRFDGNSIIAI